MRLSKIYLVVDMNGCPNRCKHCWLSHMPNIKINDQDDQMIVDYFKEYADKIEYYSWLREPDYCLNYEERWNRDNQISIQTQPERFELASFYQIVRDPNYVKFLKKVGVKKVQLTLFGLKEMTDKYVGRKGAYEEILKATNILLDHQISPRWQAFINEENKDELIKLLDLIEELNLKDRCKEFNEEFKFFIHAGSCDGENRKLYPIRINKENIPEQLIDYYLDYKNIYTEQELYEQLKYSTEHPQYSYQEEVVLNISNQFDVYFNYTHMIGQWKIGNMKEISSQEMMRRIIEEDVEAIQLSKKITIGELVDKYGDSTSHKVFEKEDYIHYLFNQYLEDINQ